MNLVFAVSSGLHARELLVSSGVHAPLHAPELVFQTCQASFVGARDLSSGLVLAYQTFYPLSHFPFLFIH